MPEVVPRNPQPPSSRGGWRKGWRRAYLVRVLRSCMSQGSAGPRCRRSLCCEAELGAACPSVAVCAQSHCSISALGCAPPSPPSLRARSLARCQPPRWSLERVFFYFFFFLCLYLTCHSPRTSQRGRATRSIMHNSWPASAAVAAAPGSGRNPSPAPIASGSPRPWGRSRCGASGLSSPMSGGWEQKKGTCLNGDAQPCAA